jgi:hypothetical protein
VSSFEVTQSEKAKRQQKGKGAKKTYSIYGTYSNEPIYVLCVLQREQRKRVMVKKFISRNDDRKLPQIWTEK